MKNHIAAFSNPATALARFNMIEQQIRTWDVLDPEVLQGLAALPREQFVPSEYTGLAFADIEIPIGEGQTMLSPKLEGRFLQALQLRPSDKVLQIGTGSGYFTALMAQFCQQVFSFELNATLCKLAKSRLKEHGISNVLIKQANGLNGLASEAPFDVVVACGSMPVEPLHLREQLAVGGRMLLVLGRKHAMHATLIVRKTQVSYKQDVIFETQLAELMHAPQDNPFSF